MKKLTKIVLLVVVLVMSLVLATACETLENHEHKPASEWLSDGTSHYHACTFEGCTEKLDVTACAGGTATCTEKATCATCGAQYGELAEHKFNLGYATEEFLATPATHTDKAYYYMSCACGLKGTETFQAGDIIPHEYEKVVTEPTCTTGGYTTYTCDCGDSYVDNAVPALGHKFVDGKCSCGAEYVIQTEWMLTTQLKDGDQVLIGAPAYGKLLSAEKVSSTSYYNKGVDYSATDFANVTDSEIFVVKVNDDGSYTFTSLTGKVIALADSYTSLNDTGANKSWELTAREDGTFLVKNTVRGLYLEWYSSMSNWSTYSSANSDLFYISFYVKNPEYSDVHVHNHISAVTAPTCTEAGYTTYTCECSDTYVGNEVDATGHTFVYGICACGEKDPTYVDYYLIGYINGADYGNAGDWENLGEYKFVDGSLVATFTADSYVGIKSANLNGEIIGWFWSQNYETSNVGTFEHGKNYGEKMFISGNTKVMFTLVVNEDGSLTLTVEYHKHTYEQVVTDPTCTADGYTTYTCECGDTYTDNTVDKLGHVDADLDIECDREGCTSKVAPKAESTLSTFTANCLGSKLSTSNMYYVEGTIVEVLDAKNGVFLIDDGTGEKFYFRLPKDANGVSHANWEIKLVLGDKVQIYGKINKFTSTTAPNGQYWPAMQSPVATVLEQHPHDFTTTPATCSKPAYCACGQSYGEPLGCADTNGDQLCDDCSKNVNYIYEYVEIRTDNNSGVIDETAGTYTWSNDNFSVQVAKGTSSQLYKTAKDHMRIYKGNNLVIANKNGLTVKTITVYLTNATQVTYFTKFLTGYTYTTDTENFTVTFEVNSAETLTFANTGSTTQIKGVEFGYEKPQA